MWAYITDSKWIHYLQCFEVKGIGSPRPCLIGYFYSGVRFKTTCKNGTCVIFRRCVCRRVKVNIHQRFFRGFPNNLYLLFLVRDIGQQVCNSASGDFFIKIYKINKSSCLIKHNF